MKKHILTTFVILATMLSVYADDKTDVMNKFNNYVNDTNNYSTNIPNYYTKNPKIIRVVNKKQGGQQSVVIPYDRYLKEMSNHAKIAKAVKYKNRYEERKIVKIGNDYKITAIRIPRNDRIGLLSHFIFTKVGNDWKIREESMTTNVQTFLNAK